MIKNGLFVCSIGFLIILYTFNPATTSYDIRSMATGIFLVVAGGYLFFKGRRNELNQKKKSDEVSDHGNC